MQLWHDKQKVLRGCTNVSTLGTHITASSLSLSVCAFAQEGEGSGKRKAEDDEEVSTKKPKKYVISDEEEEEEEDD